MVNFAIVYLLALLLFFFVIWLTFKSVKETKDPEKRRKAITVYGSIYLGAIILAAILATVGKEPMNNLFYWLGGQTSQSYLFP